MNIQIFLNLIGRPLVGPTRIAKACLLVALAASCATADEWSWVDQLRSADATTRQRLKICAASTTGHLAAVRAAAFNYDLGHEDAAPTAGNSAVKVKSSRYRGRVRWLNGAVHYDFLPDPPLKEDVKLGVIRSSKMLAYLEYNSAFGLFLIEDFPPPSIEDWYLKYPARLPGLDPRIHFGGALAQGPAIMRTLADSCRLIDSEEVDGLIHIRFYRSDSDGRVDFYCDKAFDYLPVKFQAGDMRGAKHRVFLEETWTWLKSEGVWYPSRFSSIRFWGESMTPIKVYDLKVEDLRVNASARLSDSSFQPSAMDIPDAVYGIDRRSSPPVQLVRIDGKVRQRRPSDKVTPSEAVRSRLIVEQAQAAAQHASDARVTLLRNSWSVAAWSSALGILAIGALLGRRAWARHRHTKVEA